MKTVLLVLMASAIATTASAQKEKKKPITATSKLVTTDLQRMPFAKGTWQFDVGRQNLNLNRQEYKVNGQPIVTSNNTESNFNLYLGANYYFMDKLAFGLELANDLKSSKNQGSKQTNNLWMGYANFTYGTPITNNLNVYLRAGVGVGKYTNKYKSASGGGTSTLNKANETGYKIEAGFPIQLDYSPVYLTPIVGYRFNKESNAVSDQNSSELNVGLKLQAYLACKKGDGKRAMADKNYAAGSRYVGVSTSGSFTSNNITTKYANNAFTDTKVKINDLTLAADYMYYVVPGLAVGAGLGFNHYKYQSVGGYTTYKRTGFSIMPQVELNMPTDNAGLRNLFVRGGYGFGTQRITYSLGVTPTTDVDKYRSSEFKGGLGYNFFFHRGLAFTPVLVYDYSVEKNKVTGVKTEASGPGVMVGVRKFF